LLRQCATVAVCGAAALAGTVTASADSTPVCVETGLLAVQASSSVVPVAAGPSLAGPERTGATTPEVADAPTGLVARTVTLGVAGCVDAAGTPGGTTARAAGWSLLGGAVSGRSLRADLVPAAGDGAGWRLRVTVDGLRVEGRPTTLAPGVSTTVGDWGVLRAQATLEKSAPGGLRWWRSALQLRLLAPHAGFPAGTTFLIGWTLADRQPVSLPPPVAKPPSLATTAAAPVQTGGTAARKAPASTQRKAAKPAIRKPVRKQSRTPTRKRVRSRPAHKAAHAKPVTGMPLHSTPPLGGGPYTFPVAGDVSFGDTYGALRSDVPGGWHHGDDLFAPLGTPIVAVTDGTIFSVGWNRVGGWRLWLLDSSGDEFYYAHLSGYTALGANGRHVRRGDVLGYVGNTGDAVTTPTHLHFEIHPVSLLYLGYDGAVDPTSYLDRWSRLTKVRSLSPVPLPGRAPSGWGAVTDFRQLLALRPMRRATHRAPAAEGGRVNAPAPAVLAPKLNELALDRRAVGPVYRTGDPGGGDGSAALVAAILLAAGALLALAYTARSGRSG
jgi:murein DD-endopeptidase MepM/ murein hydrolase activator NlpD